MMFFRIILLFCLTSLVAFSTHAQMSKNTSKPLQEDMKREDVMLELNTFLKNISKGKVNGEALSSLEYFSKAKMLKEWIKNPWIEADTEITRSWYIKLYKLVDYMRKAKYFLEKSARMNDENSQAALKVKQNFVWAYRKFAELLKNPEKVDPKRLRKLRKQKKEWMKKARAKMEKTGSRR